MTRLPTYVNAITLMTINLTTVLRPEQATSRLDHLVLAGAGVLAHRVRPDGTLSFSLDACAAPAGAGESVVIDWLEDELAVGGLIAGYDLYRSLMPLIGELTVPGRHLDLAAPAVADTRRFRDLTERVQTGAPVTFAQACSRANIVVTPADQAQQQNWWGTGDVALGRRAAAEFDAWRRRHPSPVADDTARPLSIIAC